MRTTVTIKKYGNRRLYDTNRSKYVSLDEVAAIVREGYDIEVLDASTNADLTQATLIQLIVESRDAEKLLPVPLLMQLVRMHDTAVAQLMGEWLSQGLELYLKGAGLGDNLAPYFPAATAPYAATNAFARMMLGGFGMNPFGFGMPGFGPPAPGRDMPQQPAPPPQPAPQPAPAAAADDVAELRRELEALRRDLRPGGRGARPERPVRPKKKREG